MKLKTIFSHLAIWRKAKSAPPAKTMKVLSYERIIEQQRRLRVKLRARRKQSMLDLCCLQALAAKHQLHVSKKGRNGNSMGLDLFMRHADARDALA